MTTDLNLMHKRINMASSPILYNRPFTEVSFIEDWEPRNVEWYCKDGSFYGRNPKPGPGVLLSRRGFTGNVLLDFWAQTVLPSTHDIDVMWNLSWDECMNRRGQAYVAGLQGWWDGKVGIEKSPDYRLVAAVPCPWFEAGREYHIQAGGIDGHCFIFVDNVLRLELFDPCPIDSTRHNRIGFEAYQSMVRIRQLTVHQIVWEPRCQAYPSEF